MAVTKKARCEKSDLCHQFAEAMLLHSVCTLGDKIFIMRKANIIVYQSYRLHSILHRNALESQFIHQFTFNDPNLSYGYFENNNFTHFGSVDNID